MIELCCEYLSVRCILLYVLIISCTRFRVNLCKSAGNQVNVLTQLKSFLGLKEGEVLLNSFICLNFNYAHLYECSQIKSH